MSRRTRSEARVGVELDSDQFVGPGVDYMLLACDSVQATAFILVFLIFLPIVSGLGSCFFFVRRGVFIPAYTVASTRVINPISSVIEGTPK